MAKQTDVSKAPKLSKAIEVFKAEHTKGYDHTVLAISETVGVTLGRAGDYFRYIVIKKHVTGPKGEELPRVWLKRPVAAEKVAA